MIKPTFWRPAAALCLSLLMLFSQCANAGISYIHSDSTGLPTAVTDGGGKILWKMDHRSYGEGAVNEDVDGDGVKLTLPIRYPGQYRDVESGLHYNYYRYYDPSLGRYITSDPIGLAGGINTYAYVGGDPVNFVDPFGLDWNPSDYPNPNGVVPGGPWEPNQNGRPGNYLGPIPEKGGRAQCQFVPDSATSGGEPYWKTNQPGQKGWQRYNQNGEAITPEKAHGHGKSEKRDWLRPKGDPRNPFTPSPERLPPGHPLEEYM